MDWSSPDSFDIIDAYREVMDKVQLVADQKLSPAEQIDLQNTFLSALPTVKISDLMQRLFYQRLYTMFFNDWLLLDYRQARKGKSLGEVVQTELKDELSDLQVEALRNLNSSFIAPYRILSYDDGYGRLENIIYPETTYQFFTYFSDLMPGDVIVARLLRFDKSTWFLQEPWLVIIPREERHLVKSLHRTVKETGFSKHDTLEFCKNQAIPMLKTLNEEIIRMEKDAAEMIEEIGFHPIWREANIVDRGQLLQVLDQAQTLIRPVEDVDQFVFINPDGNIHITWAYILLTDNQLVVGMAPREDHQSVGAVLNTNELEPALEWTKISPSDQIYTDYSRYMLDGLAALVKQDNELIDSLLIPRKKAGHTHIEQNRADFFASLSLQLGKRL